MRAHRNLPTWRNACWLRAGLSLPRAPPPPQAPHLPLHYWLGSPVCMNPRGGQLTPSILLPGGPTWLLTTSMWDQRAGTWEHTLGLLAHQDRAWGLPCLCSHPESWIPRDQRPGSGLQAFTVLLTGEETETQREGQGPGKFRAGQRLLSPTNPSNHVSSPICPVSSPATSIPSPRCPPQDLPPLGLPQVISCQQVWDHLLQEGKDFTPSFLTSYLCDLG